MLKNFQAARAIAALCAAAFHLSISMGLPRYGGNAAFSEITQYLGANRFFFVLSGFTIFLAHAKDIGQPAALGTFVYKRFTRLIPLYWLYTLIFSVFVLMGFGTDAKIPSNWMDWLTAITLIRFTPAAPPLTVAWTLFHELAFYAVFAVLIWNKRAGMALAAVAVALTLLFFHHPGVHDRTAWNVYTAAYNLYFLFGIGAWYLSRKAGNGVPETVLALILVAIAMPLKGLPHQLGYMILIAGFAFFLAGMAKLEKSATFFAPALLVRIGNASYTIYLIHEQVQGLLLKVVIRSGLYGVLGARLSYIVVLAGTVAIGYVVYQLVERPMVRWFRRRYEASAKPDPRFSVAA
ncbi:acyltransferase [Massilia sp. NR 4-1]|uniref:acyltransferase family protein n=1 Tax=Massilia sp. NR 4-1 TaxID=1678028 RepID=UPI0009E3A43B|nr:acyltransferase [Massilia sp. NR 4-1]